MEKSLKALKVKDSNILLRSILQAIIINDELRVLNKIHTYFILIKVPHRNAGS